MALPPSVLAKIAIDMEERQSHVARLYARSRTQREIAAELGVSQTTVFNDLQAIRERWKEDGKRDYSERVAIELEKLRELEGENWRAYERSLRPMPDNPNELQGDIEHLQEIREIRVLAFKVLGAISSKPTVTVNNSVSSFWDVLSRVTTLKEIEDPVESRLNRERALAGLHDGQ